MMHTFNGSAIKVIENHLGKAFVKNQREQTIQIPMPVPMPGA